MCLFCEIYKEKIKNDQNGNVTIDYFCKQISYFKICMERNYENVLKNKCERVLELQQMYHLFLCAIKKDDTIDINVSQL